MTRSLNSAAHSSERQGCQDGRENRAGGRGCWERIPTDRVPGLGLATFPAVPGVWGVGGASHWGPAHPQSLSPNRGGERGPSQPTVGAGRGPGL